MTTTNLFDKVLAMELPAVRNAGLRSLVRKERSAAIRGLMKDLGLRGVSVTTPVYSMARVTEVRIPREVDYSAHLCAKESIRPYQCPSCQRVKAVEDKLTAAILAAFPDLDDRSEIQSDYFDYVFSVGCS